MVQNIASGLLCLRHQRRGGSIASATGSAYDSFRLKSPARILAVGLLFISGLSAWGQNEIVVSDWRIREGDNPAVGKT